MAALFLLDTEIVDCWSKMFLLMDPGGAGYASTLVHFFFNFMQFFFGEMAQIIGWLPLLGLASSSGKSWIRHCMMRPGEYDW